MAACQGSIPKGRGTTWDAETRISVVQVPDRKTITGAPTSRPFTLGPIWEMMPEPSLPIVTGRTGNSPYVPSMTLMSAGFTDAASIRRTTSPEPGGVDGSSWISKAAGLAANSNRRQASGMYKSLTYKNEIGQRMLGSDLLAREYFSCDFPRVGAG